MGNIKEITVSFGRTVGLPGFSSIRYDASETISVKDGDKKDEVYDKVWKELETRVNTKLGKYTDEGPGKEWLREDAPEIKVARGVAQQKLVDAKKLTSKLKT